MGKMMAKQGEPLPTEFLAEYTMSDSVLMGVWHVQVRLRTLAFVCADGYL